MKTITVLVVPVKGAIVTREIPDTLAAMQAIVGGLIERVTIAGPRESSGRTMLLYVNEEGICDDLPVNIRLTEAFGMPLLEQPLHGDGFLTAVDGSGETQSLTDDEVSAWSRMIFLLGDERLHECKGGSA